MERLAMVFLLFDLKVALCTTILAAKGEPGERSTSVTAVFASRLD
jgi:hypothetical protein